MIVEMTVVQTVTVGVEVKIDSYADTLIPIKTIINVMKKSVKTS